MEFMKNWTEALLEEMRKEEEDQKNFPVKLIRHESRAAVWDLCDWFGFAENGVPGLACQLLEKYLSNMHRLKVQSRLNKRDLSRFHKLTEKKLPLLISVIILLVVKMTEKRGKNNNKLIIKKLKGRKIKVSFKKFYRLQFEIFSKIGFKIPLWTNVNIGIHLALASGISEGHFSCVESVINFAEFKRDDIEQQILSLFSNFNIVGGMTSLLTLHFIAGILTEIVYILNIRDDNIVPKLSRLVNCPIRNLNLMSAVIETVLELKPSS